MLIKLSEIPKDGKKFEFSRQSAELNETLQDLIGDASYSIEFTIVPLNSKDFELSGFAKSAYMESCSHCGVDFKYRIDEKYHEIITPYLETPRDGKYAKVNHLSDVENEGISSITYRNHIFNFGEYIHEVIAISIPLNPAPDVDSKGHCVDCGIDVNSYDFGRDEEMSLSEEEKNPFAALKKIKLNS